MRIRGRTLYANCLEERRLLKSLGTDSIRAPRNVNPYVLARRIARAAKGPGPDMLFIRDCLARSRCPRPPRSSPHPEAEEPSKTVTEPIQHAEPSSAA